MFSDEELDFSKIQVNVEWESVLEWTWKYSHSLGLPFNKGIINFFVLAVVVDFHGLPFRHFYQDFLGKEIYWIIIDQCYLGIIDGIFLFQRKCSNV